MNINESVTKVSLWLFHQMAVTALRISIYIYATYVYCFCPSHCLTLELPACILFLNHL